ncbi:Coiled-coil domain-containing protein 85C [Acromyrmex echinatior]|uniref:Coiled-coil domain-containing protein 85C n=1 Tax=Acromyrmex echinatior TaxID=103372 RepID=F4W5C9_ACREC|nr:Coiled-coil domain-containing protein 85C [Acromyrmex echinatior]
MVRGQPNTRGEVGEDATPPGCRARSALQSRNSFRSPRGNALRKEIVEDALTRAREGEDGTGHPMKCGPSVRKTGTRRAATVEERAGQGIASTECSHAGCAVTIAKSYFANADKKGLQTWSTSNSIRESEVKVELLIDENWCIFTANEDKSGVYLLTRTKLNMILTSLESVTRLFRKICRWQQVHSEEEARERRRIRGEGKKAEEEEEKENAEIGRRKSSARARSPTAIRRGPGVGGGNPPPQPTSGILKNHLHFTNGSTSAPGLVQTGSNQGPGAALNHHQTTQPRTLPPLPSSSQHHQQQQHQSQQPTQSQQQSQQQPPSKDAQSKYSPRIEHHHHHHPQPGNPLIAAASAAASKSQQQPQPSTYLQPKLGQGQYLPPSSQYPAVNNGQSTPVRQRISDDEFLRLGPVEMLKFVRKTESDIARLAAEQNRQIQNLLNELRLLKEANQRLNDDNQELRDLCCFLDDDRQKGRKLAREWQRFGRYTVSVMRQEVSAYQNKLRQLDNKKQELMKNKLKLKHQRIDISENGDGSSSSTKAEETAPPRPRHTSTFNGII